MEPVRNNTQAVSMAEQSVLQQVESFLNSPEPMQVFSSDCLALRDYARQKLLKEYQQDSSPLVIQAHAGFGTEYLLRHLRDHWRLLTPVSEAGFRAELDGFLQVYRRKVQHGLLLVTEADQLPIATQAALMHLAHRQEQQGAALKVVLLASDELGAQLRLFRPEGVAEIRMSTRDPAFTQWVVQQAAKEQYVDEEPVPADIVDLAHSFSKGDPADMRWIVDRWYAAADYAKRDDRGESVDVLEPVPPVMAQLGKSRFSFWNSRQAVMSGFMVLALTVGVATHHLHHQQAQPLLASHQGQKTHYTLQALDATDRMQALQWVAHHPGLQKSHVITDKDTAGKTHYHVEFGRFASKKEASQLMKKLQDKAVHVHRVV
jgi:hypothetical protein